MADPPLKPPLQHDSEDETESIPISVINKINSVKIRAENAAKSEGDSNDQANEVKPKRRIVKFRDQKYSDESPDMEPLHPGSQIKDKTLKKNLKEGENSHVNETAKDFKSPSLSRSKNLLGRSSTLKRDETLDSEAPLSRMSTFFSRTLSRTSTLSNNLSNNLSMLLRKRDLQFETAEEVEKAAAALEEARQKRLEEGEGPLEKVTTFMLRGPEILTRNATEYFQTLRQQTFHAVDTIRKHLQSEEMQRRILMMKDKCMTLSTGKPYWHSKPTSPPLPSVINMCTLVIVMLSFLLPLLFSLQNTRDDMQSFFLARFTGQIAGPDLPPLDLTTLGASACYSAGFGKKNLTNVATMNSMWWSNALGDKSQFQLYSEESKKWWSQSSFSDWENKPVGTYESSSPPPTTFFTFRRVNSSKFYILAPNNKYLKQMGGEMFAAATKRSEATLFSLTNQGSDSIIVQTDNGGYVSLGESNESGSLSLPSNYDNQNRVKWKVRQVMQIPKIRGVNLGNWLLIEQWMTPSIYKNAPDLIDGYKITLRSVTTGKYVRVDPSDSKVKCDTTSEDSWSTFHIRREGGPEGKVLLRLQKNGNYLSASNGGGSSIYGNSNNPGSDEMFTLKVSKGKVMLQTSNGKYLRENYGGIVADAGAPSSKDNGAWNGNLAFYVQRLSAVQGEYQVSVAFKDSEKRIQNHRRKFMVEDDWKYLASKGINTVRVPVGWWIAQEDSPDAPYIPGALDSLDTAFELAEKYSIRIWLSLHAAPGGQNPGAESSSRDGIIDWGKNGNNRDKTLDAIDFLANRYEKSVSFLGMNVLNEPNSAGISMQQLRDFQLKAYDIIRSHSPCAFVGISGFVDQNADQMDNFMSDPSEFTNVIMDVHYYHVFTDSYKSKGFKEHLDILYKVRAPELTRLNQNDRTVFIGEWSLALPKAAKAKPSQYKKFGREQLKVYNNASAGWFFWTYKVSRRSTGFPNWSFFDSYERKWLRYK